MVNSFLAGSLFTVTTGLEGNKSVQVVKIAVLICAVTTTVTNDVIISKTYLDTYALGNTQNAELTIIV